MDPLGLVALTRALVDIDSTTGREAEAGHWLSGYLRRLGYRVEEQPVDADRFNLFATLGPRPRVVLSTHFDCVPPFIPSRIAGGRLYGRGSCDAKGILAAQVVAAERLRASGVDEVGLLFVVGEERGSDGARASAALASGSAFLVNGEPTDNRLGLATRGVLRVRLVARGRAAHSSYPELGESAIDKLIDALVAIRAVDWPSDPVLGDTHFTTGLIAGGVAPNVVSPHAEAEVLFRTVGAAEEIRQRLRQVTGGVAIEEILEIPPVTLHTVPGFETAVFPYTTDIALLGPWGRPLLYGPGSILVAHTADEYVEAADLERAARDYVILVEKLLGTRG